MKKAYLLVYSDGPDYRNRIKRWADTSPIIYSWRYDLPYSFYLISEAPATEICDNLQPVLDSDARLIITEITSNVEGLIPADTWRFLHNKRSKHQLAQTESTP